MKTHRLKTRHRSEWVDITAAAREAAVELGLRDGALHVFVPHTTAGVTINEHADPDVAADVVAALDRMVPWNGPYAHAEGNAAAHIKASMMGASVRIAVEDGALRLGTWQGVFFCEFDGPRAREVWFSR